MATSSPAPGVSLDTSALKRPKKPSGAVRRKRKKEKQKQRDGQLLVFGVDDASLTVLRNSDGKAHLELSRVTFDLLRKNQENTEK